MTPEPNNITVSQNCPCGWQANVSVTGRDLSYQRVGEMAVALLRGHPHEDPTTAALKSLPQSPVCDELPMNAMTVIELARDLHEVYQLGANQSVQHDGGNPVQVLLWEVAPPHVKDAWKAVASHIKARKEEGAL